MSSTAPGPGERGPDRRYQRRPRGTGRRRARVRRCVGPRPSQAQTRSSARPGQLDAGRRNRTTRPQPGGVRHGGQPSQPGRTGTAPPPGQPPAGLPNAGSYPRRAGIAATRPAAATRRSDGTPAAGLPADPAALSVGRGASGCGQPAHPAGTARSGAVPPGMHPQGRPRSGGTSRRGQPGQSRSGVEQWCDLADVGCHRAGAALLPAPASRGR